MAYRQLLALENRIHHQLIQHSISALRLAVGAIFLGFGVLKYFPGVSPSQNLTEATPHILFFGLVPGRPDPVGGRRIYSARRCRPAWGTRAR